MAKNHIQPGDTLTIAAPATVASGAVVIAGSIAGIALGGAASGAPCDVAVSGVFLLPKVAADNVTLGAPIYWDATAGLATIDDDTGSNPRLGTAVAAAAASTGTVKVRLVQL
jgi:predicted RecA/RadA family phage recombinase